MKEKTTANMHCLTLKTKQTVLRKYVCIKPLQKTSKTLPSKMPPAMLITYTEHKKTQTVQYLHMYTAEGGSPCGSMWPDNLEAMKEGFLALQVAYLL